MVTITELETELSDNLELFEMSKEDGDEAGLMTIEGETAKLAAIVDLPSPGEGLVTWITLQDFPRVLKYSEVRTER